MPSEKEKMLAGELYDPLDADLVQARTRARALCQELNARMASFTFLLLHRGADVAAREPGLRVACRTAGSPPASLRGRPGHAW